MTTATVHRPPDYVAAECRNVSWALLPRRQSSDTNLTVMVQRFRPGGWFATHRHDLEQFFYVTCGALEMTIDGETRVYRAGEFVRVPRNAAHGGRNATETDSEILAVDYWPADSEDRIGLD